MSMNIQRKNSAYHFCMQSERKQTLITNPDMPILYWHQILSLSLKL